MKLAHNLSIEVYGNECRGYFKTVQYLGRNLEATVMHVQKFLLYNANKTYKNLLFIVY
jgi:hypothetical protein